MKIQYTRQIFEPDFLAGKAGDQREFPDSQAQDLIDAGFAVPVVSGPAPAQAKAKPLAPDEKA